MSASHLQRLFKQLVGTTIHEYIMQCRLEQASMLLLDNRMPAKQIAEVCGFRTVHHFTRRFTQRYGKPPATLAREILGRIAI
jgi:AraC-like DNA-binding protein